MQRGYGLSRHRPEDRQVEMCLAALARRDAAYHCGAVVDGGLCVEAGFASGEALENYTRASVHQDCRPSVEWLGPQTFRDDAHRIVAETEFQSEQK